jgi:hypothetical protein
MWLGNRRAAPVTSDESSLDQMVTSKERGSESIDEASEISEYLAVRNLSLLLKSTIVELQCATILCHGADNLVRNACRDLCINIECDLHL